MAKPAFDVDPNRVSAEELVAISGIGLETARAIVRYREEHGPITSWDDLKAILDEVELVPDDERSALTIGGPQQSSTADAAEADVSVGAKP